MVPGPQHAPTASRGIRDTRWYRVGMRVLRMLALFAVLFAITIRIMAPSAVFQPDHYDDPSKAPRTPTGFEDVWLTTADGVRVHGWYAAGPGARATLLYFHGNAGNLDGRRGWIASLRSLRANVFALEYRGYGRSGGRPSEAGLYADADAAYAHLTGERGLPPSRIVVYGKSVGGGPACELASHAECAGVILQSTFTSVPAMANHLIPVFPAGWFVPVAFDNEAKVANMRAPLLLVHSTDDEMIPYWMAERLKERAGDNARLVTFERSGHNELIFEQREAVLDAFRAFLKSLDLAPAP